MSIEFIVITLPKGQIVSSGCEYRGQAEEIAHELSFLEEFAGVELVVVPHEIEDVP